MSGPYKVGEEVTIRLPDDTARAGVVDEVHDDGVGQVYYGVLISELRLVQVWADRVVRGVAPELQSDRYGPLTGPQANALADVLRAAQGCLRVAWLLDGGEVAVGTARSIGDERGNFAPNGVDIRGEYLRVTGDAGFEHFFKVIDLLPKIAEGTFVVNYQG